MTLMWCATTSCSSRAIRCRSAITASRAVSSRVVSAAIARCSKALTNASRVRRTDPTAKAIRTSRPLSAHTSGWACDSTSAPAIPSTTMPTAPAAVVGRNRDAAV
nr:hypothetical protein [Fodinicola feengrottensis]